MDEVRIIRLVIVFAASEKPYWLRNEVQSTITSVTWRCRPLGATMFRLGIWIIMSTCVSNLDQ